jgi:hypothetical protein
MPAAFTNSRHIKTVVFQPQKLLNDQALGLHTGFGFQPDQVNAFRKIVQR